MYSDPRQASQNWLQVWYVVNSDLGQFGPSQFGPQFFQP